MGNRRRTVAVFLIIVILGTAGADFSMADQTAAGCHCFRNRSFDPAKPYISDTYLETTAYNSFLATRFNTSKRTIVMRKMQGGVDETDLFLCFLVGEIGNSDPDTLLIQRNRGATWPEILADASLVQAVAADDMLSALASGVPAPFIAGQMRLRLIRDYFQVPLEQIEMLRKAGVSDRQAIIILTLCRDGKISMQTLLDHLGKGWSFSQLVHERGYSLSGFGDLLTSRNGG